MKAIFEMDVPESCATCKLNINSLGIIQNCIGAMEYAFTYDLKIHDNTRAPFCPLKFSDDRDRWQKRAEALEQVLKGDCFYCKHYNLERIVDDVKHRRKTCGGKCSINWQFDEARFAADEPEKGK